MTKLEQLQNKITEIIPEIKELKMGCRIRFKGNTDDTILSGVIHFAHEWKGKCGVCIPDEANSFGYQLIRKEQIVEVVGRDITLADVLRVYYKKQRAKLWDWEVNSVKRDAAQRIVPIWNLEHNALHLQEQETINFLWDIICKE